MWSGTSHEDDSGRHCQIIHEIEKKTSTFRNALNQSFLKDIMFLGSKSCIGNTYFLHQDR